MNFFRFYLRRKQVLSSIEIKSEAKAIIFFPFFEYEFFMFFLS